jgi:hypothetical protein
MLPNLFVLHDLNNISSVLYTNDKSYDNQSVETSHGGASVLCRIPSMVRK